MARPIGIRIHKGAELVDTQVFERDIIKIGRLASAHLRLEDPKVSRIHAVIEVSDAKEAAIIDMGSAEGTRVNGEKVSRVRLKHGDEIGLGDSRLVIVLDDVELAALKGGAAAAPKEASGPVAVAGAAIVTDVLKGMPEIPPPPPSATTNGGVFQSGETDVSALRKELSASVPSPGTANTDVFDGGGIDVSLNSLAPQPAVAPAMTAKPASTPPVAATPPPPVTTSPPSGAPPRAAPPPTARVTGDGLKKPPAHAKHGKPSGATPPPLPSILPPLPPIPEDSITPENRYVEVTLRWGGTVTDVKRIKNASTFSVGNSKTDALFVPLDGGSFNLLTSAQGQGWTVHWKDGMGGSITRGEHSAPLSSSGTSVTLSDDTVVSISAGYHTIQVRVVPKSRLVPIIPFFDLLWANTAVVTLFAASAMIAAVGLMPIGLDSLDDDLLTNPTKFQTLILKPPPKDNTFLQRLKGPKEQKQAAAKDAGKAGDKKADPKKDQGKMASKAKDKPTDEQVVASKMSALFGDKGSEGIAALFGADASGGALEAALGGIDGAKVAAGYGTGGLGLRGGGPGGGGVGVGTLGTGKIGTRGRGSGEAGYGGAEGGLGAKTDRDVTMTQGTPVVLGSLDPEIIRRIVREHSGQIKYCYEKELIRTPGIYGKIVMKWVINGDGKVTASQVAETQMKNANVEQCLATKIRTWVFPKPKGGGIVVVNYPFVFKQGG